MKDNPRQRPPFLIRLIMILLWAAGFMTIVRSAGRIRYDEWGAFYAAVHVLMMIGLVLFLGWVIEGEDLVRFVFGRLKGKARRDDDWLE